MTIFEKSFIYTGAISILLFITIFIWFLLFGGEQYYRFDPYIDTEMSEGYSPELFKRIQVGITKQEVEDIIGDPIFIDSIEVNNQIFSYTNDGKLLNKEAPWYIVNDYAWYLSTIEFYNDTVININKGWIYD